MAGHMSIDQLAGKPIPRVSAANRNFTVEANDTKLDIATLDKALPGKPQEKVKTYLDGEFEKLDLAIERTKREIDEFREMIEAEEEYAAMEKENEAMAREEYNTVDDIPSVAIIDDEDDGIVIPKVKVGGVKMTTDRPYDLSDEEIEQIANSTLEKIAPIEIVATEEKPKEVLKEEVVVKLEKEVTLSKPAVEEEVANNTMEELYAPTPMPTPSIPSELSFVEDDDLDLEDVDEDEAPEVQVDIEKLRQEAKEITAIETIDLGKFTIKKKPISISTALNNYTNKIQVADWVLRETKQHIAMSQLSGTELGDMNELMSNRRGNVESIITMLRTLYAHLETPNKPSFEGWMKTISYNELEDIYFAEYRACFGNHNHVIYTCPHCGESFLKEQPIESMVKFKDEETKNMYAKVMNTTLAESETTFKTVLVQVNNTCVISVKTPSVYDMMYLPYRLRDFYEKYQSLGAISIFVDQIYVVDKNTSSLVPINMGEVAGDEIKTEKNKIRIISKIFKTFNSDDYARFSNGINELSPEGIDELIKYVIPETDCKYCEKEIPSTDIGALQLLFTRHNLSQLAFTSEK